MKDAGLAVFLGAIALLVLWAYKRHALDNVLGLNIDHGDTLNAANVNVTLKRTDGTTVSPYGPMFNPAGVVTSTAPTGPTFSPHYQNALAKVHEPGGARDPFADVSDGSSWMASARDAWFSNERDRPYTSLSEGRGAWFRDEQAQINSTREYLGRLN